MLLFSDNSLWRERHIRAPWDDPGLTLGGFPAHGSPSSSTSLLTHWVPHCSSQMTSGSAPQDLCACWSLSVPSSNPTTPLESWLPPQGPHTQCVTVPGPLDPWLLVTLGSFTSSGRTVGGRGWSAVCWPLAPPGDGWGGSGPPCTQAHRSSGPDLDGDNTALLALPLRPQLFRYEADHRTE